MNIYNAKNNSMPEQVLENKKNIELLNTGKQDKLVAGQNISIDPVTNVISASGGGGDSVIYENVDGEAYIPQIPLEIGGEYEMFITSAVDADTGTQFGQQKIAFKFIPSELMPNEYDFYMPVHWYDLDLSNVITGYINIYSYNTEFWTIVNFANVKIYKIVKKAV